MERRVEMAAPISPNDVLQRREEAQGMDDDAVAWPDYRKREDSAGEDDEAVAWPDYRKREAQ